MTAGERIKKLREKANYSQRQLAMYAKISNATISRIEKGEAIPDLKTLSKLAKALNTTPSHIMGWDERKEERTMEEKRETIDVYDMLINGLLSTFSEQKDAESRIQISEQVRRLLDSRNHTSRDEERRARPSSINQEANYVSQSIR